METTPEQNTQVTEAAVAKQADLNSLSGSELQKIARAAASAFGHPKTWIAAATKEALLSYIANPEAGAPKTQIPEGSDLIALLTETLSKLKNNGANVQELLTRGGFVANVQTEQSVKTVTQVGLNHKMFTRLMRYIQIGLANASTTPINIWLVGPAGTGKTTSAKKAAQALGAKFSVIGVTDNEYKLKGFCDANGRIVNTIFREAWIDTEAHVLCLDEIDGWLPGAQIALNSALANGTVDFPDGNKERGEKLVVICGANTLHGPTGEYVARFRPDAAFTDRFVYLPWEVDTLLERALATGNHEPVLRRMKREANWQPYQYDMSLERNIVEQWVDFVQECRVRAANRGIKVVVSPRCSYTGALLLKAGEEWSDVVESCLTKGLQGDQLKALTEDNWQPA